jgi:hypothetical protein
MSARPATVCGVVEPARCAQRSTKQPTFLNLGEPHPNQSATIVIFGRDRARCGTPQTTFAKRRVCATGVISLFQDRAEMKRQDPSQLSLAPRQRPYRLGSCAGAMPGGRPSDAPPRFCAWQSASTRARKSAACSGLSTPSRS